MFKYFKKKREIRNREIAKAVYAELSASKGWEKFLPPVVLRDKVYMVTENGSIYAMKADTFDGYEQIITIQKR